MHRNRKHDPENEQRMWPLFCFFVRGGEPGEDEDAGRVKRLRKNGSNTKLGNFVFDPPTNITSSISEAFSPASLIAFSQG
jgi:hypothetical protein